MEYTSLGIVRDYPINKFIEVHFYRSSEICKDYGLWVVGHLVEQEINSQVSEVDFLVRFEVTGADSLPSISGSYGIITFRGSEVIEIQARR